jgi:hypothetical protein
MVLEDREREVLGQLEELDELLGGVRVPCFAPKLSKRIFACEYTGSSVAIGFRRRDRATISMPCCDPAATAARF